MYRQGQTSHIPRFDRDGCSCGRSRSRKKRSSTSVNLFWMRAMFLVVVKRAGGLIGALPLGVLTDAELATGMEPEQL